MFKSSVVFRSNLNIKELPQLIEDLSLLRANPHRADVLFDLSKTYFVFPLSACLIKRMRDEVQSRDCRTAIKLPDYRSANRQARRLIMNVSDLIGERRGQLPTLPVQPIVDDKSKTVDNLISIIESHNHPLPTGIRRATHFAIQELLMNVIQHSHSDTMNYVCANQIVSKGIVRISVLDSGIGIRNSLKSNPLHNDITTDKEAIQRSLRYGVTRYTNQSRGIFLDMLVKLIRHNGGILDVISGNARVGVTSREIQPYELPVAYPGTIVNFQLKIRKNYKPLLDEWEDETKQWILP